MLNYEHYLMKLTLYYETSESEAIHQVDPHVKMLPLSNISPLLCCSYIAKGDY